MICSVGDERLRIGLMLAGMKKHYVSLPQVEDEEIIITSRNFFELNRKEFEILEDSGKVVIKYDLDKVSGNSGVRELI